MGVLTATLLLAGCRVGGPGTTSGPDTLTVLVAADGGQNYDPQTNASPSSGEFIMPVFEPLLTENSEGEISGGLASAWRFSAAGKTLTLTLRKGVTFHDGTAFDAKAVKSNIERGQTNDKSVVAGQLGLISSIRTRGRRTVVLNLKSAGGALLGFLAGPAGMMGSPKAFAGKNYPTHPVGTGPWEVSDASQPGSDMVYTKFGKYHGPAVAKASTIHIRNSAESTFVASLNGGSTQAVMLTGAPTDTQTLKDAGFPVHTAGTTYLHLLYLNKSGVFADPKVREAVSLAIDRQAICTALLDDACTVTGQPLKPDSWAYDTSKKAPAQDKERAKALLADAGHADGFEFKAVVSSTGTQLQTELTAIQQMLADVGIKMSITPMPVAQLLPTFGSGDAEAYYSVNTGGADPAIPLATMAGPAYNPGEYDSAALSSQLAEAGTKTSTHARAVAYRKASSAYQDVAFNVVVLNQDLSFAVGKKAKGLVARDPLVLDVRGAENR